VSVYLPKSVKVTGPWKPRGAFSAKPGLHRIGIEYLNVARTMPRDALAFDDILGGADEDNDDGK
jgi:hypothetical protein